MPEKKEEGKGSGAPKKEDENKDQTPAKSEFPAWATATVEPGDAGSSYIPVNFRSFEGAFEFCKMLLGTGFLPAAVETPGQAMAIAIYGQELGIPLMTSFRSIHVVNGKPGLAAEMMLTKFQQRGGVVEWGETSDKKCEGVFISKGTPKGFRSEFTIEKAHKAGLAGKQVWKAYPEDMLRARCISRGVRGSDPGAIGGSHSPEELGGDVLSDGTVITLKPEPPVSKDVDLGAPMKATTPGGDPPIATRPVDGALEGALIGEPEANAPGAGKPFSKMTDEEKTDYASDRETDAAAEAPDQVDAGEQAAEARDEEAAEPEPERAPAGKPAADDPHSLWS